MRKKLTPRDREIIQRLFVGQTPKEIAEDLGMHPATITRLADKEPLFATELGMMAYEAQRRLTNSAERLDALTIIQDAAGKAAKLCDGVVGEGDVEGSIDLGLRVRTAWDILDRAGHKAVEKKVTLDLSDLIIEAHRQAKEKTAAAIDVIEVEGEG